MPEPALSITLELSGDQLDALAARVAVLLRNDTAATRPLVDAAAVADELGISRDTVYARAAELGGRRFGDGPRPRWRFDIDEAREAWQPPSEPEVATPRRRRATNNGNLLPVKGEDI